MIRTNEASNAALNEFAENADFIAQATPFYPSVFGAIEIGLTILITTCSIDRMFSTLGMCQQCSQEEIKGGHKLLDSEVSFYANSNLIKKIVYLLR